MKACNIVQVGRRRDGGYRYWCLTHKSNATAKYGRAARQCVAADDPVVRGKVFRLKPDGYPGGIAIWGAVPPVYDTTTLPIDRGIHVHARTVAGGKKDIDDTFRRVALSVKSDLITEQEVEISELDAIYYMVSHVFGKTNRFIKCTFCSYPHLDRDWFSVHEHKRHLCHGCGRNFSDTEEGIGNPAVLLQQAMEGPRRRPAVRAKSTLVIRQKDYPGGIRIWGSNSAIVWTSRRPEKSGIHVHAFDHLGQCVRDGTYGKVVVDGIPLLEDAVRYAMALAVMPHISDRVVSVDCPNCGKPHLDLNVRAYEPHEVHVCSYCANTFRAPGRLKNTIGNPMASVKKRLTVKAVRPPRNDSLHLRPETI